MCIGLSEEYYIISLGEKDLLMSDENLMQLQTHGSLVQGIWHTFIGEKDFLKKSYEKHMQLHICWFVFKEY